MFFFSSNFSILFLYFRTEIKSLNWGKGTPTNWNRAVAIKISKAHQLKLTCRQFSSDLNNFRKSKKRKNNHRTILQINLATTLTGLLQENFLAKKTRAPTLHFSAFRCLKRAFSKRTCFNHGRCKNVTIQDIFHIYRSLTALKCPSLRLNKC